MSEEAYMASINATLQLRHAFSCHQPGQTCMHTALRKERLLRCGPHWQVVMMEVVNHTVFAKLWNTRVFS